MGKRLILIAGAFALACGAEPDEMVDGAASSSEEASSSEGSSNKEASNAPTDSEKADDVCSEPDVSKPEAALATDARVQTSTECTVQVTGRGKQIRIEYSIK